MLHSWISWASLRRFGLNPWLFLHNPLRNRDTGKLWNSVSNPLSYHDISLVKSLFITKILAVIDRQQSGYLPLIHILAP